MNWQDRENPRAGGAETHLHEVFGRLATGGHDVTLLVSGWSGSADRATLDGMDVHRVGGRHTFSAAAPLYYRRHLRDREYDVMVEDLNKVPLFTPLWSRHRLVLLVHHLFGVTAFQEAALPLAAVTWALERPLARFYRGLPVQAVSRSTADDLERRGLDAADVEIIPNGVDLEFYTPAEHESEFETPTVLYLGRLKRYKRVDLLLRATALLRGRGVACRLVVAGTGDASDSLRSLRDELGLGDVVTFPGYVSGPEKRRLFRGAWVHALTSPKEGWGITNLEAAACATPTVASDSPGLRDSVVDGETGFLVPHGDVEALAGRLAELLGDAALRRRMGGRARAFAERFTWERAAEATEAHLRRVVDAAA